jgi:plastocyanin
MKKRFFIVGATALLASLGFVNAADITGKVTLKGTPPPENVIKMDPKSDCGKLHTDKPLTTRFYVTDDNGGLADTVVYLKDVTGQTFPVPSETVVLDQVNCEYTPHVVAIRAGQKLAVRNSDPFFHNVHPTPAVPGNPEKNSAQAAKAPDLIFTFPKPEAFLRFKCDVHPWMFAYVSLFDHPYFAVSGKDGSFKIANVPPGKYTLEAHHRKGGKTKPQEITVTESGAKLDITIEVPEAAK